MTEEQYLLLVLEEECSEVAKVCSKAIRFGIGHTNPELQKTNYTLLLEEYCDLLAAFQMLVDDGIVKPPDFTETNQRVSAKKTKVRKMMEYSRSLGRLEGKEGESGKSKVDGDVRCADL